jgi:hypothetical protein
MVAITSRPRANRVGLQKAALATTFAIAAGSLIKTASDALESPNTLNLFAAEVALFAAIGIVLYSRHQMVDIEREPSPLSEKPSRSTALGLGLVWTISMTIAIWSLSRSTYVTSWPYYLALATAIATVGVRIVLYPCKTRWEVAVPLGQATVIGLLIQVAYPLLNPRSVVSDMAFHWLGIQAIVATGFVPQGLGFYQFFPAFHILNGSIGEMGLENLENYAIINHALVTIAIPAMYLLSCEVVSSQKALMSALLLTVSLFFFLWVPAVPSLVGGAILILATYALLRFQRTAKRSWWATFWILAAFVFLVHPVDALILAGILLVLWVNNRWPRVESEHETRVVLPTGSYVVLYLGYLSFMAVTAFGAFLSSIFESGPRIFYTNPVRGPVPASYVGQSIVSTLGFSLLLVPASVAILSWIFTGQRNHRMLAGLIVILTAIAGATVLAERGSYGLQAARTLLFLSIFIVLPAGSGIVYLAKRAPMKRTSVFLVVALLVVLAFFSSTSYLTGSGNRILSSSIPIQTSYITDSILASRNFLRSLPPDMPLGLDPVLADYFAPLGQTVGYPYTVYPVGHTSLVPFSEASGNASVALAISAIYLNNRGFGAPQTSAYESIYGVRGFDDGTVQVYLP